MAKVFRVILFYLFAISFAKLFGVFRSLLLARIMEPGEYGVWLTLQLIITFGPILSLGVVETLIKQVPFYIGNKDNHKRIQVESNVFSFLILVSFMICAINIFLKLNIFHINKQYLLYIQIMLLTLSISMISSYFLYRLKAYQEFKIVSILQFIRTTILLICQITLTYYYGLLGAVLGFSFCELFICIISTFVSLRKNGKFTILINTKVYIRIVRIGFPITIIWWIYIIQSTTDRVICMWLLGSEQTGFYGLGASFVSVFLLISTSVSSVLYPKMNESYGKSGKKVDLKSFVLTPTIILSIVLPIIIIFIYFAMPFIYKYMLNNYLTGLISAQLLIVGAYFGSLIRIGANFIISINKQNKFIKYVVLSALINLIGNYTLVYFGHGINGIAFSTVFTSFLLTTLLWFRVYKSFDYSNIGTIKCIVRLYMPIFIIIIIGRLLLYIIPSSEYVLKSSALIFLVTLIIYIFFLMMVPYYRLRIRNIIKKYT